MNAEKAWKFSPVTPELTETLLGGVFPMLNASEGITRCEAFTGFLCAKRRGAENTLRLFR